MKKFAAILLTIAMVLSLGIFTVSAAGDNLVTGDNATFDKGVGNWSNIGYWNAPEIVASNGAMVISHRTSRISTPVLNIIDYILAKGAGDYTVSLGLKATTDDSDGEPIKLIFLQEDIDGDEFGIKDPIYVTTTRDVIINKTSYTDVSATFTVISVDTAAKTIEIGSNDAITELYVGIQCTDRADFEAEEHDNLLMDNFSLTWAETKPIETRAPQVTEAPAENPTEKPAEEVTAAPTEPAKNDATAAAGDATATSVADNNNTNTTEQNKKAGMPVWVFIIIGVAVAAAAYAVVMIVMKKKKDDAEAPAENGNGSDENKN